MLRTSLSLTLTLMLGAAVCGPAAGQTSLQSKERSSQQAATQTSSLTAQTVLQTGDGEEPSDRVMRVGMIGLDTSHCIAFAKILNDPQQPNHIPGFRVTVVYPRGSPDIASSTSRVPKYTVDIGKLGVAVVDNLDAMIAQVDAVLLETNDGRPHLEQVVPVLRAGKPCFIDKPLAGSLADGVAIYRLAEHFQTPVFSASSLRYGKATQAVRNGSSGEVTGCDTWSPCKLEPTHPDLFWYGIHGVESLFTVMGKDCVSVQRTSTSTTELVVGTWNDGRLGSFRGLRSGAAGYGGTAFTTKSRVPVGQYEGYAPLVMEITKFFRTREAPVTPAETLAIYAFMEAADESKRQSGQPVAISDVMQAAQQQADATVRGILQSKR